MNDDIRITLLANAGLLICYRESSLLLDALQDGCGTPFSPLPVHIWQELLQGSPRFSSIDALLFTHLHPDHFSADLTLEYLRRHPTRLFLPYSPSVLGFNALHTQFGSNTTLLSKDTATIKYSITPDVGVCFFQTQHLGKEYRHVPHFCYILTFGQKNILFTADIDYTSETLLQVSKLPLNAAFVNPLFFSALCNGKFFNGSLSADCICVYHIPFAADNRFNTRIALKKHLSLWSGQARAIALQEPLQEICL